MQKKKKRFMITIAVVICVCLFCVIQNQYLTVTYYIYENAKLPKTAKGYRMVQLSDLHNASFGAGNGRLLGKIEELKPDMIVITGDIIDSGHTDIEVALELAQKLVAIAPTYYVTGNHENWLEPSEKATLLHGLQETGVVCLQNTFVEIVSKEVSFTLIGLDDESLMGGTLEKLVQEESGERLQILLAHEPQYLDKYAAGGVDLVLSGHAHGGQFRLPFVGGVVAPDQGLFPKYTEGIHVQGSTTMIISRGLGNSVIPLRLFNLPEIVCVDIRGGN